MSTREQKKPYLAINAGSMAGSIIGSATVVQGLSLVSYQAVWSGTTPVGDIHIQASDDFSLNPDGSVKNAGTWNDIFFSVNGGPPTNTVPVSGNTGSDLIFLQVPAYAVRPTYQRTSGTGTLNVTFVGKVS